MNIKELAIIPELIEITLDSEELVTKYGEPITFHTWSNVKLPTYFDFFNARQESEYGSLEKMLRQMVLNDKGETVLGDNEDLPIDIAAAAINKLSEILGKSLSKKSTQTVGEQQNQFGLVEQPRNTDYYQVKFCKEQQLLT